MLMLDESNKKSYSGNLFIIIAPSGAGKSSLVNALLKIEKEINLSVSHTTRQPRKMEQNGVHYHFVSEEFFLKSKENGDFLESAKVHGNYYGTSRSWIESQMNEGQDVLLEIDWQGAQQVRHLFHDAVSIFILPPSIAVLEHRLKNRGQDSDEIIKRRVQAASEEISHAGEADYVVINDDFNLALQMIHQIVTVTRLRFLTQKNHHPALFKDLGL